jgi:hypothetical protein
VTADPIDDPDRFVSRHHRPLARRKLAFDDVQIRSAHAADHYLHTDVAGSRFRRLEMAQDERRGFDVAALSEDHGSHTRSIVDG